MVGILLLVPLIGILLVGAPITVWLCLQCCGKRYTVEFKKNEEVSNDYMQIARYLLLLLLLGVVVGCYCCFVLLLLLLLLFTASIV